MAVHIVGRASMRLSPRWGDLIADLMRRGYSLRWIARHCGSHHSALHRLLTDPRAGPSFETGARLVALYDRINALERAATAVAE